MSEQEVKEISVYSAGTCVFKCYGTVFTGDKGQSVRITETDGSQHTVYNAVVIVKARPKNL